MCGVCLHFYTSVCVFICDSIYPTIHQMQDATQGQFLCVVHLV